jgi:hypothetical protein
VRSRLSGALIAVSGITGFVNRPLLVGIYDVRALVTGMSTTLSHRGTDDMGTRTPRMFDFFS